MRHVLLACALVGCTSLRQGPVSSDDGGQPDATGVTDAGGSDAGGAIDGGTPDQVDGGAPPDGAPHEDGAGEGGVELFASADTPVSSIQDIASDGIRVVWSEIDACAYPTKFVVHAEPAAGAAVQTLLTAPTDGLACGIEACFRVLLTENSIVASNSQDNASGSVVQIPKDGGVASPLVQNQNVPCAIGLFNGRLYYAADYDGYLVTVDGNGTPTNVLTGTFHHIAVDGTSLYVTATSYQGSRSLVRADVNADGSLAVKWATQASPGRIGGVTLGSTDVFWADTESGTILTVPKTGGTPVQVASGLGLPQRLVFVEPYLYFTTWGESGGQATRNSGIVGRLRIDAGAASGPVTPIAAQIDLPVAIAVDDAHVYWVDAASHIWRAPLGP